MIEHIGGNPAANANPWSSLFKTIAILRIGAGVLLLTQHGWRAGLGAYEFLWQEKTWDWAVKFQEAAIPYPLFTAPAAAIVLAAVAVSWTVGFLTRLFAAAFMPLGAAFIFFAGKSGAAEVEVAWLYLLIAFTLLLFGSGAVSLDKLFRLGESWSSKPKKRKKR